jgi:ubiquinone/menaquinone biosynthesis C-methylase UbiE
MRGRTIAAGAALAAAGISAWERLNPKACPYGQRWMVQAPRPLITRPRLLEALEPAPGEELLDLGPGTGYYSLTVARALGAEGTLHLFDLQQEMLDHTMREAERHGVRNLEPRQGDARELPYGDDSLDGAYLITVLGEIPEGDRALEELRRVVRPGGRVVFGEVILDPHIVTLGKLRERCEAAGLRYDRHVGNALGYFARFSPQR